MTPRNPSPFTPRRVQFLDSLSAILKEIDDPDGVIIHDAYEYRTEHLKSVGRIPKIRFTPHGRDVWYKAEVMRRAGLVNAKTQNRVAALRDEIGFQNARDEESRILARQFESEWNSLMLQLTKAVKALAAVNYRLSRPGERLAEPVKMLQGVVMERQ